MFADVETLTKIVGRSPEPVFIDSHKPVIIPLPEFGKRELAYLFERIEIEREFVAFDDSAPEIAKLHCGPKALLCLG